MRYEKKLEDRIEQFEQEFKTCTDKVIYSYGKRDSEGLAHDIERLTELREMISAATGRLHGIESPDLPLSDTEETFLNVIKYTDIPRSIGVHEQVAFLTNASEDEINDAFVFLLTWGLIRPVPDAKTGDIIYELRDYGEKVYKYYSEKSGKKTSSLPRMRHIEPFLPKDTDRANAMGPLKPKISTGTFYNIGTFATSASGDMPGSITTVRPDGEYLCDGTDPAAEDVKAKNEITEADAVIDILSTILFEEDISSFKELVAYINDRKDGPGYLCYIDTVIKYANFFAKLFPEASISA